MSLRARRWSALVLFVLGGAVDRIVRVGIGIALDGLGLELAG